MGLIQNIKNKFLQAIGRGPTPEINAPRAQLTRREIAAIINFHGNRALIIAKDPAHSPIDTGELIASIVWIPAVPSLAGVVSGELGVGVPYGRRQEFENPTKAFYLYRAFLQVQPGLQADLGSKLPIESIFFGRSSAATFQSPPIGGGIDYRSFVNNPRGVKFRVKVRR